MTLEFRMGGYHPKATLSKNGNWKFGLVFPSASKSHQAGGFSFLQTINATTNDLPASSLTGTNAECRLAPTRRVRDPGQFHAFEKFRRKHEKSLMGHSACRDVAVRAPLPCAK